MLNFGIEYELENSDNMLTPPGWTCVEDGTLREYGNEFIFTRKKSLKASLKAVGRLLDDLTGEETTGPRCSMHIHVDTSGIGAAQITALIMGLIANDQAFFGDSGRHRNNFCTPVFHSPAALPCINHTLRQTSRYVGELRYDCKYLSINPMPLFRQGSIELRHFQPILSVDGVAEILERIDSIYRRVAVLPCTYAGLDKRGILSLPGRQDALEWTWAMYQQLNRST